MVKNSTGGKKGKKQKNSKENIAERKLELCDTTDFQVYAQITKAYGSGRYNVNCFDNKERMAHARGNLKKKKVFVKLNDVVVVSIREFQPDKCDILYVYNSKEVKELKKLGEIPLNISEDVVENQSEDIGIDIVEENDDTIDIDNI